MRIKIAKLLLKLLLWTCKNEYLETHENNEVIALKNRLNRVINGGKFR